MAEKIIPPSAATVGYSRNSTSVALATIVEPAANTKGIRIASACVSAQHGGGIRLMVKTSAPASWQDGAAVLASALNGVASPPVILPYEMVVPPGYGLYEQSSLSSNNSFADVAYEVLG